MSKSIGISVACICATLVAADEVVFGQAGSTGGTLGKTDKSVSGARESSTKTTPHRHTSCAPIIGTWLWSNGVTVTVKPDNTTAQSDGCTASLVCANGEYSFIWSALPCPANSARMSLSADGHLSGTSTFGNVSATRRD
jgi:hypothetical protein